MADRLAELWCMRSQVPTAVGLAFQLGSLDDILRRQGGVVRSVQESRDHLAPHFDAALPHSLRQGGSIPALWARANGQDTRMIGITWTDEYQAILAMPASGIKSAKDLNGRRIGIPRHDVPLDPQRASALRAFKVVLATAGLSSSSVQWVDLADEAVPALTRDDAVLSTGRGRRGRHSYTNEIHALARGDVDAVYMKDVRGAQTAHMLGASTVMDIGFHPDPFVRINNGTPRPLTVNAQLLEQYPDLARDLLRRVVQAGFWAQRDQARALQLIAKETGWAEPWIRYAYRNQVTRHLHVDLSEASIQGLATLKNFLVLEGILPHDLDIKAWIDPEPMNDVIQSGGASLPLLPVAIAAPGAPVKNGQRLLH